MGKIKTDDTIRGRDQTTGASDEELELNAFNQGNNPKQGMFGQNIDEPYRQRRRTSSEKIINGKNNSYISLGRDRSASTADGYGGRGHTQCGMIDLVVGANEGLRKKDDTIKQRRRRRADPNFFLDSARIYISQKCDIDEYFGLAVGSEGFQRSGRLDSTARSGIGIKADHVRIIGRGHVKIISGRAKLDGAGPDGEANSQGGERFGAGGIDLIAGNYTEDEQVGVFNMLQKLPSGNYNYKERSNPKLQPVVKGDNLIECLHWIEESLNDMQGMIAQNSRGISQLATGISTLAATSIAPTSPFARKIAQSAKIKSIANLYNNIAAVVNNVGLSSNFLDENGKMYICSNHINVT
jgi:hypothetical protein